MTLDSGGDGCGAERLLGEYTAGSSFLLSSARGTLLARGVDALVPKTVNKSLVPDRASEFFAAATRFGRDDAVIVGAIPFDDRVSAHLVLPSEVHRAPGRPGGGNQPESPLNVRARRARWRPSPAEFERTVRRVLARVHAGELDEVAVGRAVELATPGAVDVDSVVRRFVRETPGEYGFSVDLPVRGQDGSRDGFGPQPELGRTLFGGGAQLLVSRQGNQLRSATRIARVRCSGDVEQDRRRAAELRDAPQVRREHERIVAGFRAALSTLDIPLATVPDPVARVSGRVVTVATELSVTLPDPAASALELAVALQPIARCGGVPFPRARSVIQRAEPFDRGYFAGLVGWCDQRGDGEWVVAESCGEAQARSLRLFATASLSVATPAAEALCSTTTTFAELLPGFSSA